MVKIPSRPNHIWKKKDLKKNPQRGLGMASVWYTKLRKLVTLQPKGYTNEIFHDYVSSQDLLFSRKFGVIKSA